MSAVERIPLLCTCLLALGCSAGTTGGGAASGSTAGSVERCVPDCDAGFLCVSGACIDLCSAIGQSRCGAACADLQSDNAHCGSCDTACTAGQGCIQGTCAAGPVCPTGQTACGDAGACVDLLSNGNNCGVCGKPCAAGDTCLAGSCASPPPCPDGLLACAIGAGGGLQCVDSQVDPNHCGGCKTICGANSTCSAGSCSCDPLFSSCASNAGADAGANLLACVDLAADAANCGGCGAVCLACERCQLGSCGVAPFDADRFAISLDLFDAGPPSSMVIAGGDFNGDGLPDLVVQLVVAPPNGKAIPKTVVAIGLPDGGFAASLDNVRGVAASQILVADINGDGLADFVELGTDGTIEVLEGSYDAGLHATPSPGAQGGAAFVAAADIYGTGRTDLAAIYSVAHSVFPLPTGGAKLFLNSDGGRFVDGVVIDFKQAGSGEIEGFAISDLNADGLPDLVALFGGDLEVAYQRSDGGFGNSVSLGIDGGISLAPYGQDGHTLAIAFPGSVALLVGSDAGVQLTDSSSLAPGASIGSMLTADLNGDGLPDVVTLYEGQASLGLFLRDGTTFDYGQTTLPSSSPSMAALTGDGGTRIAVVDQANNRVLILGEACR